VRAIAGPNRCFLLSDYRHGASVDIEITWSAWARGGHSGRWNLAHCANTDFPQVVARSLSMIKSRAMVLTRQIGKSLGKLAFVGLSCLVPMYGTSLIGTTVTGILTGVPAIENFYDPANGDVPSTGFQNSPSSQDSSTVTIVGGNEFGFSLQGPNTSFSGTGFTVSVTASPQFVAFGAYRLTFTDAAFESVSLINNSFPGLTYGISSDVITIDIPFTFENPPDLFSASFGVNETPEPSSFVFMAIGAGALVLCRSLLRA